MAKINLEQFFHEHKPRQKAVVVFGGNPGASQWRQKLKALVRFPTVQLGMETQELQEEAKSGMQVIVLSPKDNLTDGLSAVLKAAFNEPERSIVGILDSDDGVEFSDGDKGALKGIQELISDKTGTFVGNDIESIADEINQKLEAGDYDMIDEPSDNAVQPTETPLVGDSSVE